MQLQRGELRHPDQRREVAPHAKADPPPPPAAPDLGRGDPLGPMLGTAFLVEVPRLDAVGIPLQGQGPAREMREQRGADPRVVVDDLALREAGGVEDLVEVGERQAAPVDLYFLLAALLRDRLLLFGFVELLLLVDERPLPELLAGAFLRCAPSPSAFAPASSSPRTAARLSSSAAIRSGAL